MGSSPHSRGTHHRRRPAEGRCGIIPAFAGNTTDTNNDNFQGGDHPRIRGEHSSSTSGVDASIGSSPHSRGTQRQSLRQDISLGIIPAFAGNTIRQVKRKQVV